MDGEEYEVDETPNETQSGAEVDGATADAQRLLTVVEAAAETAAESTATPDSAERRNSGVSAKTRRRRTVRSMKKKPGPKTRKTAKPNPGSASPARFRRRRSKKRSRWRSLSKGSARGPKCVD